MTKSDFIEMVQRDPFRPFTLRVGGKDITVSHRQVCSWHPELPQVFVVTRDGQHPIWPEKVELVTDALQT